LQNALSGSSLARWEPDDFPEVGWPSRSVGHARCKHRETDKPIGKPVHRDSLQSRSCGSFGLPRTSSLAVLRLAESPRLAPRASGLPEGPSRTCLGGPPQSVTRSRASSVAFASSSKPPSCTGRSPAVETTTARQPPLLGFVGTPLHRRALGAGPVGVAATGTCRDATPDALPLSWFRTTSAVDRLQKGAGVLHPAADHGVRRVSYCVPLLRTGQAGRRAHRHPRDAFRTPRRIPSPAAAPRHRGRCLLTVPPTSGPAGRPRRFDGLWPTDCSADLHTSPGASSTTEVIASSPGIDRAPDTAALPPPPLRVEADRGSTGRVGRFKALLRRRVRASRTGLVTGDASTVLPGLRSPSRSSCIRPCGRDRRRHRRSGRGHRAPIRRPVDACRARCDEDHTRRQAWGAEDTGKPGPRPDATLAGRAPRFAALAGPGTESLRGFTRPPLARRPGAPGVCPEPEWARRVRRFLPGCPSSE